MSKKKSNMRAAGVLLVLILMLMLGLIYINYINGLDSSGGSGISSLALIKKLDAKDKESMLCNVDDSLAEASGAIVRLNNINGEEVWNKNLQGKVVRMKGEASNLYILDSSKKLYCISKDGNQLWEKQLEGDIRDIHIDISGDVLIDYVYNSGTKIQILSKAGVDEGSLIMENAALLAFASGEGENTLSIIDISSQVIKGKLITLNLRGDMVWSDNFDNEVIPLVGYSKENTLIAIGEKTIYHYKDQSKKLSKEEINKTIYNADISSKGIVVVTRNKNGFEISSYDWNLKKLGQLEIEEEPSGIIMDGNNYILYYSEKLLVADYKGKVKAEYKSLPEIKKVDIAEDGSIIAVSDRLIQKLGY